MLSFLWCCQSFVTFCRGFSIKTCCIVQPAWHMERIDPPWLFLPLGLQRSTARAAAEVHELRIDSCRSLCVFHSCPVAAHYLCIQHCFLPAQRKHETRTKIFPNNNVSGADTHCGLTEKVDAICGDGSHAFPEEGIVSHKGCTWVWVSGFSAAFH